MKYKRFDNIIAVQMFKGEDLMENIKTIATKEQISFAKVDGIGRISNVVLGYYGQDDYIKKHFNDEYELTNITGNIVNKEVHLHVNMAENGSLNIIGGHLFSAKVALIAEIFITIIEGANVTKEKNEGDSLPSWSW